MSEEIYKDKYLKYKAKYLELKKYEQQGGLLDSGFGLVFTSKENADKLRKAITGGKINGRGDIADLLDRQAYIVFDGKKPAELLESTTRIMKEKMAAAYKVTADVASKTASATVSMASKAATATADAALNQYNKYKDQKEKEAAEKAAYEEFKARRSNASITGAATLVGGAGNLPLTIPTFENKTFDRASSAHREHMISQVAKALGLQITNVQMVSIKFKMLGKPELRD